MTDQTPSLAPGIRLSRLVIQNYKRLDHLAIDFPLPRMAGDLDIFVLGSKNGGGKTSVLECCSLLMLAGAAGEIRPQRYRESESLIGLLSLLVKAGCSKAVLKGEFQQGESSCSVHVSIEDKGFGSPMVSGDCFKTANNEPPQLRLATLEDALNSILALSSEPLIRPPILHFNSYRKVQEANPELGMLAEEYSSNAANVRRRLLGPRILTPVSAFKLEILRSLMGQASLFEGLDDQESETTLDTLNSLIDRYCGGRIEKLRQLPDNRVDIRIKPRNSETSFSFDGLSSGQKEMIATLFLIWRHTAQAAAVVLIDEPELHLNAEWHGDFVEQLRRLAPQNQYILATHSEEIFRSVDESRRAVLVPDEDRAPL